jgi:tetratricopeptide (TPR) repeat protein
MVPLSHPDSHRLNAAEGWLELGDWLEANEELENIAPQNRAHPDVLKLRVKIYSAAKKWEMAATVAGGLVQMLPEESFCYVKRAFALHELKRTQEAWDALLPVADKFPDEWVIPYNLACYAAQLGWIKEAENWFKRAMKLDEKAVQHLAIDDPNLEPLWKGMSGTNWKRETDDRGRR